MPTLAKKNKKNNINTCLFQLYLYYTQGGVSMAAQLGLMFVLGFFSNGPYALITTAVSADLVRLKLNTRIFFVTSFIRLEHLFSDLFRKQFYFDVNIK